MKSNCVISIYHDTRRPNKEGLYRVKLRVFSSDLGKARLFATKYAMTKKDFASAWNTVKTRSEYREIQFSLKSLENHAYEVAEKIKPFSFEAFERRLKAPTGGNSVFAFYDQIIARHKEDGQIGTSETYRLAMESLKKFLMTTGLNEPSLLQFNTVTPDWLKKYENYMTKIQHRTSTTVGIYLRTLRAVFNAAINDKEVDRDLYPFGKSKYIIPAGRKIKKALPQEELARLYHAKPETDEQARAQAFWFLSYSCKG
ncbi:MAG: phage integrase SAM-like domain-containing protein, partial [Bacteroidia bacterium]|nr:phage integrase SAM-like domain-containing protein [Bacteroidia bacterium]